MTSLNSENSVVASYLTISHHLKETFIRALQYVTPGLMSKLDAIQPNFPFQVHMHWPISSISHVFNPSSKAARKNAADFSLLCCEWQDLVERLRWHANCYQEWKDAADASKVQETEEALIASATSLCIFFTEVGALPVSSCQNDVQGMHRH
jgi:hypothetical protein